MFCNFTPNFSAMIINMRIMMFNTNLNKKCKLFSLPFFFHYKLCKYLSLFLLLLGKFLLFKFKCSNIELRVILQKKIFFSLMRVHEFIIIIFICGLISFKLTTISFFLLKQNCDLSDCGDCFFGMRSYSYILKNLLKFTI